MAVGGSDGIRLGKGEGWPHTHKSCFSCCQLSDKSFSENLEQCRMIDCHLRAFTPVAIENSANTFGIPMLGFAMHLVNEMTRSYYGGMVPKESRLIAHSRDASSCSSLKHNN